ncbi:MAG: hypothetical protein R3350_08695, partial [Saprospiraceae bacterium]|nr:hypothetical protein [Saprospiraceae bacterium]
VFNEPSRGDTYVGLITREDGSWESIGQRVKDPLKPGECYSFTIDVGHSTTYAGYASPIRLRIWGGLNKCRKDQLLLETDPVESEEWETLEVQFWTKQYVNYLIFEAFFGGEPHRTRGNILIDNIGPIKKCVRASLDTPAPDLSSKMD